MVPDDYIDTLIGREAGYVNNPSDKGGETIWGITVAVARAYGYTGPMRNMPRTTAEGIYRSRYWLLPKLDQINAVDPKLAEKLLDIGVNMGQSTGITFLQRALNVLNMQGKAFPDIARDGSIGPMTMAALKAYYVQRGAEASGVLVKMIAGQQSVRYIELAEKDAMQEAFEFGWQRARAFFGI
ncbi:glycoside hydrolase family 108 protein [Paraburkholderia sacchari]|uniref:glycoside hydrolase family 108 protein n=1 Tax=Paraburkholderia sacchari TaxID=159450 RepID=UPI001BCB2E6B|nr:glycosyl hydrolase 108 family protein [Paraburkholderia sacchari]